MSESQPTVAAAGAARRPRTATSALLAGLTLIAGMVVLISYAPNSYSIYKALHVIAIVIWVGVRVYTPAAFAAFAFGVALMQQGVWDWSQVWIVLGLAGWAIATGVGVLFVGPELGRIDRAAAEHGPESAEVARRVRRLFTIFRFDTVLLVLIVLDMVLKPTF